MNQYLEKLKNMSPLDESSNQSIFKRINSEFQETLTMMDGVRSTNDKSLRAIIGFDHENSPVYWNMNDGHLLGCASTGVAMNFLGASMAILDLSSRFSADEFGYYYVGNEGNYFSPKNDDHCIDAGSLYCKKGHYQEDNYRQVLEKIQSEWNSRKMLSEEELSQSKTIVVIFGNPIYFIPESRGLCLDLLENGLRYHFHVIYLSTRLFGEKEWCELNEKPMNISWFSGIMIGKSDSELSQFILKNEKAYELDVLKHCFMYQSGNQQMLLSHGYQSIGYYLSEAYENNCKK